MECLQNFVDFSEYMNFKQQTKIKSNFVAFLKHFNFTRYSTIHFALGMNRLYKLLKSNSKLYLQQLPNIQNSLQVPQ